MKIPAHLKHKPIIQVENYDRIDGPHADDTDAMGLSVGIAQWNTPGWTELSAVGINNHGQIIGWGHLEGAPGGGSRAFLLSPIVAVPEPGTYAMLLAGLGLLGVVLRRRQQAI